MPTPPGEPAPGRTRLDSGRTLTPTDIVLSESSVPPSVVGTQDVRAHQRQRRACRPPHQAPSASPVRHGPHGHLHPRSPQRQSRASADQGRWWGLAFQSCIDVVLSSPGRFATSGDEQEHVRIISRPPHAPATSELRIIDRPAAAGPTVRLHRRAHAYVADLTEMGASLFTAAARREVPCEVD